MAVADVTSAASYAEMSVEDIIVTAGVSRRTFYEHFKNKDDAFLAAYEVGASQLVERVVKAVESEEGFAERTRAGLSAFLDFLADAPAFARMCIVEVLAAGPEAITRRNEAMRVFAELLEANAREFLDEDVPALTAETVVGGIYEVVYARILRGEIRDLPGLKPELTYSTLLPYVGPDRADHERQRLLDDQAKAA
jgi:AcrR family transcriptional regulator